MTQEKQSLKNFFSGIFFPLLFMSFFYGVLIAIFAIDFAAGGHGWLGGGKSITAIFLVPFSLVLCYYFKSKYSTPVSILVLICSFILDCLIFAERHKLSKVIGLMPFQFYFWVILWYTWRIPLLVVVLYRFFKKDYYYSPRPVQKV